MEHGHLGKQVTSAKLLKRLEGKGLVARPDFSSKKPSARRWGGTRGHCFVEIPPGQPSEFDFEGNSFTAVTDGGQTLLYKKCCYTL